MLYLHLWTRDRNIGKKWTSKEGTCDLWRPWGGPQATQVMCSVGQDRLTEGRLRQVVGGRGGGAKIKMLASQDKVLEFGFPELTKMSDGHSGLLVTLALEGRKSGFLKKIS